jgi:hypothetical protein
MPLSLQPRRPFQSDVFSGGVQLSRLSATSERAPLLLPSGKCHANNKLNVFPLL